MTQPGWKTKNLFTIDEQERPIVCLLLMSKKIESKETSSPLETHLHRMK